MAGRLYYQPSAQEKDSSVPALLIRSINHRYGLKLATYWDLHQFSISRQDDFYRAVASFNNLIIDYDPVKPLFDASPDYKNTRNLVNGRLNWAENQLLAHANRRSTTQKAIIACQENGVVHSLTYEDLYQQVRLAAEAMRRAGIKEGDTVAAFSPNNAEAAVMLLASATIGAAFTSTPAEFGVQAVLERLTQLNPVALITADRYRYGGKDFDVCPKLLEIMKALVPNGLKNVIVVGQTVKSRAPASLPTHNMQCRVQSWPDFLKAGKVAPAVIEFNKGPANRPLWILYSSGTTGKPKAIVHSAGGMLLSAAVSHASSDVGPTDVALQFTTLGWMMWNHQMMHLAQGLTLVVYDGSPVFETASLWNIVETHKVTLMGLSPRYLQVLLLAKYSPKKKHDLASLRQINLTAAPASAELYDFIQHETKGPRDLQIGNGSGGTDICGPFVTGTRLLPTYYAELQVPVLGAQIEVWTDAGERITDGSEGNLICANMLPNMPLYFCEDPGDERYHSTYFQSFPGKFGWNQSDWVSVNPKTQGMTIKGRSDGVLNPQGVRFGSAELYDAVAKVSGINDMLAVGQRSGGDERVILFVKMETGVPFDNQIRSKIVAAVRLSLSSRHVPSIILQAPDLPMTNSLKRCEIAVKKIVNGTPLAKISTSGMSNPESLAWFVNRPELMQRPSKL